MAKGKTIQCKYFRWRVYQRPGSDMWEADGRSNPTRLGRYSLDPNWDSAMERLHQLDQLKAVDAGMADPSSLFVPDGKTLDLEKGRQIYVAHTQRPRIVGGASAATAKRYRAVFDKFIPYAISQGVHSWNSVGRRLLEGYGAWLDDEGYAYATEYLELTTLKQVMKFLISEKHLPTSCAFDLELQKPDDDTTTYCYRTAEVESMVEHCFADKGLYWLGRVVVALSCLGLRISELAQLRWSNIDDESDLITISDQTKRGSRVQRESAQRTKGRRSRTLFVHPDLKKILHDLPRSADGRVFHGPLGGKLKPDTVRNVLIRDVIAMLKSRFPVEPGEQGFINGRIHSFRHYFCSVCSNSGVPEQVLMRWLGQRSSKMVRRYYHLHTEESKSQMSKINPLGGALLATGPAVDATVVPLTQESPTPQHENSDL